MRLCKMQNQFQIIPKGGCSSVGFLYFYHFSSLFIYSCHVASKDSSISWDGVRILVRHRTGCQCCPTLGLTWVHCWRPASSAVHNPEPVLCDGNNQIGANIDWDNKTGLNSTGFVKRATVTQVWRGVYRSTASDLSEKLSMQQLGLPTEP